MTLLQLLAKVEEGTATKAEEMDVLFKVSAKCGSKSYLSGLLSEDLLKWVAAQIHMDLSADIWGYAREAQVHGHEEADAVRKQLAVMETERDDLEHKVEKARMDADALRIDLADANAEIVEQRETINDAHDGLLEEEQEVRALRNTIDRVAHLAGQGWIRGEQVDPEELRAILATVV